MQEKAVKLSSKNSKTPVLVVLTANEQVKDATPVETSDHWLALITKDNRYVGQLWLVLKKNIDTK